MKDALLKSRILGNPWRSINVSQRLLWNIFLQR